jgi:hypothetical protein
VKDLRPEDRVCALLIVFFLHLCSVLFVLRSRSLARSLSLSLSLSLSFDFSSNMCFLCVALQNDDDEFGGDCRWLGVCSQRS